MRPHKRKKRLASSRLRRRVGAESPVHNVRRSAVVEADGAALRGGVADERVVCRSERPPAAADVNGAAELRSGMRHRAHAGPNAVRTPLHVLPQKTDPTEAKELVTSLRNTAPPFC